MTEGEDYDSCLESAEKRYARDDLKLCPRGYCTAKHKYDVYPSAYANGYATQVCQGRQPDWRNKTAPDPRYYPRPQEGAGGLGRWFKEEWVNVCERKVGGPGGYAPCGSGSGVDRPDRYPYCRPYHRLPGTTVAAVRELTVAERAEMCRLKRSLPQGVGGRPTRVRLPPQTLARVRRDRASQKGGAPPDAEKYPWLTLEQVNAHVPEARREGVSATARTRQGFVGVFRRCGTSDRMRGARVKGHKKLTWGKKRENFIKRHLPQYVKKPTVRRRLMLRMWAYEPP